MTGLASGAEIGVGAGVGTEAGVSFVDGVMLGLHMRWNADFRDTR